MEFDPDHLTKSGHNDKSLNIEHLLKDWYTFSKNSVTRQISFSGSPGFLHG